MKTMKIVLAIALAAALLSGCAKENVNDKAATESAVQAGGSRTIAVSFAPQTKTALGEDGLTPEFQAGYDTIKVAKKDGSASPEDCPVYIENEIAVIHTNLVGELDAVYPASAAKVEGDSIVGVVVSPKQTGKFTDANICRTTISASSQSASFENQTAILKFYVDKSIGVSSITITDKEYVADGSSSITVEAEDETSILSEINKGASNERICYVAVLDGSHSALNFSSVTTTQGPPVQKQLQEISLDAGTMYNVFLPYYIEVNGQKWGYCNIGAFLPEEPGKYFAWGSIEGFKYHYEPEWQFDNAYEFSWSNCPYIASYEGDSDQDYTFSKYVIHQKFWGGTGSMDNKQTLEPEDDAAHVAWQDQWRMPKKAELEQLANLQASSIYGKYISVDDKLILPVTGHGVAKALTQYDCDGVYWSSDLSESEYLGSYAYSLSFHIESQEIKEQVSTTQRSNGYPIRPIYGDLVPDTPTDALKGVFTVSDGGTPDDPSDDVKVHFSQGNLTYCVSSEEWAFYEHQYDCATGYDDNLISLFTWGYSKETSLLPDGTMYVTAHTTDGDNLVYDKASSEGGDDWGVAYCESNNITVGTWRTLTTVEWQYLFNTRNASTVNGTSNARYAKATVNNTSGIIILPDNYEHPSGVAELTKLNPKNDTENDVNTDAPFTDNSYSVAEWEKMEDAGAVFLPSAGYRDGSEVEFDNNYGAYWSSTVLDEETSYIVDFASPIYHPSENYYFLPDDFGYFEDGHSVRLVTNVSNPGSTVDDFSVQDDSSNWQ